MNTDNASAVAPAAEKASKWSDNEKIALFISIIKSYGTPPKWANVQVPAGRTSGGSKWQYDNLMKAASLVPMEGGSAPVPPKKRKAAADADNADEDGNISTPAKKRVRKPKVDENGAEIPAKKRAPRKPKAKAAAENPSPATDDDEGGEAKQVAAIKQEDDYFVPGLFAEGEEPIF